MRIPKDAISCKKIIKVTKRIKSRGIKILNMGYKNYITQI